MLPLKCFSNTTWQLDDILQTCQTEMRSYFMCLDEMQLRVFFENILPNKMSNVRGLEIVQRDCNFPFTGFLTLSHIDNMKIFEWFDSGNISHQLKIISISVLQVMSQEETVLMMFNDSAADHDDDGADDSYYHCQAGGGLLVCWLIKHDEPGKLFYCYEVLERAGLSNVLTQQHLILSWHVTTRAPASRDHCIISRVISWSCEGVAGTQDWSNNYLMRETR